MSSSQALSSSSTATPLRKEAQGFCNDFNAEYEKKHRNFEIQFWGTKMALASTDKVTYSADNLSQTKKEMEDLLSNPDPLKKAQSFRDQLMKDKVDEPNSDLMKTLNIIIRTCNCYDMSSAPSAKAMREECSAIESNLEMDRNRMKLGYSYAIADEGEEFKEASSVALRNLIRTSPDEAIRKAAYQGLRSIGPFVLDHGFVDIIKLRNEMAKSLGYLDYYDYKVSQAEGFGKLQLFEMLDGLEQGTRPIMVKARQELETRYGSTALLPWNTSYFMAGSIIAKMDPYFPFSKSVERYIRSYAALNIGYRGSTMNLDLLDRKNKYSNGFCHWPQPAWMKPAEGDGNDGKAKTKTTFQPTTTNFTSLADPTSVGSGLTALRTLMHEAGHAAHFANIVQPSPLFSQERAPTSVAYAENQSMFLDSLVSDAAWRAKYAHNDQGRPIPFDIIEEEIRAIHPFAVFQLRAMLSVSYFEKALYELPEDELTSENIQKLADKIELEVQGGLSARPLLSIPHLVSDEASCYYHGYTLAEMAVYQTRAYFKDKYGYIVDNPEVGPTLTKAYWEAGNSRPFLDLVKDLTGKPLSGDDWVGALNESVDDKVEREKKEYDEVLAKTAPSDDSSSSIDLNMTVKFVDGDEVISDSSKVSGGILESCKQFEAFVAKRLAAARGK